MTAKHSVEQIRSTLDDMKRHGLYSGLPQEEAFFLLAEIERLERENAAARDALRFYADSKDWQEFAVTQGYVCGAPEGDPCMAFAKGEDAPWRMAADALECSADETGDDALVYTKADAEALCQIAIAADRKARELEAAQTEVSRPKSEC